MFDSEVLEPLRAIGLSPALLRQLAALAPPDAGDALRRVVEVQREGVLLHDGRDTVAARLLPALRAALAGRDDAVAVGDWVLAHRNPLGECWVHDRLEPRNQLARRLHDGRDKVTRTVIVANVDTALLVVGLDHDFNVRRLERYAALVRMAGVDAVAVLTKADLAARGVVERRLAEARAVLPAATPVLAVDALDAAAVGDALSPWLQRGQTLVLLGSSGAGKSTLTNALAGATRQDTGPNRAGDGRGRHTTTVRTLHVTPGGACVIDTPGLRTLRLDGAADDVGGAFDDIAALAPRCRFRDCRHGDEPGCAVRAAVGAERLRNYHKLLREARRDTLTALERRAQLQQWKLRGRIGRTRAADKRTGDREA